MAKNLSCVSHDSLKRFPHTFTTIKGISIMVDSTVLNFGKRYKNDSRVIFFQWPKLH